MKDKTKPLISIVVPVYQVERYIERCINSILNQTLKNFELLIVDDGTKDDSISVAQRALLNSNIEYKILKKVNGGLSSARNYGLKASRGEYVVFVDSDDEIENDYLEKLFVECNRSGSDIVIGRYTEYHNTKKLKKRMKKAVSDSVVNSDELCLLFFKRKIEAHPCTVMYRKKFLSDNKLLFNENVLFSEDQEFYWRAFPLVKKASIISKSIYKYYVNMGTITTDPKVEKIYSGYYYICKATEDINLQNISSDDIILRWILGTLHGTAKFCSLSFYLTLIDKLNFKLHFKKRKTRFNFLISLCFFIVRYLPKTSYLLFRI